MKWTDANPPERPDQHPTDDDDPSCEAGHHHAEPIRLDAPALEAAAAFFRAAGDVARLALLVRLRRRPLCVGELAEATGEGMSTVSQRLRVLRSEGLLVRRREGRHVRYALADAHVADLVDTALAHARHHRAHRAHVLPRTSEPGGKP